MNKLHLEYLRDTGKQPTIDMWDLYSNDAIEETTYGEICEAFDNVGIEDLYTHEYIEWLENKIKELRNE